MRCNAPFSVSYKQENTTIHVAIDVDNIVSEDNATELVPTQSFKCRYCPKKHYNSNIIRMHERICDLNDLKYTFNAKRRIYNKQQTVWLLQDL